jgi:hexosaminidase
VAPPRTPGECGATPAFAYSEDGKPIRSGPLKTLIPSGVRKNDWSLSVTGSFPAPVTGIYRFDLTSDDGSELFVGDARLIDNSGDHAPRLRSAEIALERGCHPLRIEMNQHGGGYALSLEVSRDGEKPHAVF